MAFSSLTFEYAIAGVGWADATIADSESSARLTASYLGDALGDLLLAVWLLLEGATRAQCSWEEEPGEYRWLFERHGPDVHLEVVAGMRIFGVQERGDILFETTQPLLVVAEAFTSAAERILSQYGEEGYRARWVQHDFPTATLRSIRERLRAADPPRDIPAR
jgi:hypothetical protein